MDPCRSANLTRPDRPVALKFLSAYLRETWTFAKAVPCQGQLKPNRPFGTHSPSPSPEEGVMLISALPSGT